MKKSLLLVLFLVCMFNAHSQHTITPSVKKITGKWYLSHASEKMDGMIFEKAKPNEFRFGNYISILPNGNFVVAHSAASGNNSKQYYKVGTWNFDPENDKLTTSIPVHKKGTEFTVKFLYRTKMVLE